MTGAMVFIGEKRFMFGNEPFIVVSIAEDKTEMLAKNFKVEEVEEDKVFLIAHEKIRRFQNE